MSYNVYFVNTFGTDRFHHSYLSNIWSRDHWTRAHPRRYLAVDQKLQQKIKELAQPTLDSLQLPSPVTGVVLESVSFGQSPPYIEGCRTLREKWAGSRDLEVGVVLVNSLDWLGHYMTYCNFYFDNLAFDFNSLQI